MARLATRMRAVGRRWLPPVISNRLDRLRPTRRRKVAQRKELLARLSPDGKVRSGPFQGIWIGTVSTWGAIVPYLAGTYEAELFPWIEREIRREPPVIIDVGCAEGYYAIGFASRCPGSRVVASDLDERAREQCRTAAHRNGVQVEVIGECSPETLQTLLKPGALVICDCEGCELALLDPQQVPALAEASLVVELHDFVHPLVSEIIYQRFSQSHEIVFVPSQPRNLRLFPDLKPFVDLGITDAIQEHRGGVMEWAVMKPKVRN
jgi:hypothetical protein